MIRKFKDKDARKIRNETISRKLPMDVPLLRINEIVHRKHAITTDTAPRLVLALVTSEQLWMGLQTDYDLAEARESFSDKPVNIENLAA